MTTIDAATVDDLPALRDIYNQSMTTSNSNFDTHLAGERVHVALAGIALANDASVAPASQVRLHRRGDLQ